MTTTEQHEDTAERLQRIEQTSDRLYHADFLGRMYLATYVADVNVVLDRLTRALGGAGPAGG